MGPGRVYTVAEQHLGCLTRFHTSVLPRSYLTGLAQPLCSPSYCSPLHQIKLFFLKHVMLMIHNVRLCPLDNVSKLRIS